MMKTHIKKLTDEEMEVVNSLDAKIAEHQKVIDELMDHYVKLKEALEPVKKKIAEKRKELSPIAELKASICSPISRDKYHPEHSKKSILEFAKKAV